MLNAIGCVIMLTFVGLERQGFGSYYRTALNQLNSWVLIFVSREVKSKFLYLLMSNNSILVLSIYLHHKCCWCNTSLDWTFQFEHMWSLLLCKELDCNDSFDTLYDSYWFKILIYLQMEKNENNERWCHCTIGSYLYPGYFSMVMFCQVLLSRQTKHYAGIFKLAVRLRTNEAS